MFSAQVRICLQQLQRTVPRHSIWQGKTRKQPDICLNTNIYWKGISVTIQNKFRNVYFQLDKDTFVKDCKNVGDTNSESYKKIYWFSWKCFQVGKEKKFSLIKNFLPWHDRPLMLTETGRSLVRSLERWSTWPPLLRRGEYIVGPGWLDILSDWY